MCFEIGVADHVVKGKWVRADNIAKVCVQHATFGTSLKPPCYERDHGVRFAAVASKTADEIRALSCLGAISSDESRNDLVVQCCDEDLDVLRMRGNVAFGEIEKRIVKRSRDLRVWHHHRDFVDGADAELEIGILFSRRKMASRLRAPLFC